MSEAARVVSDGRAGLLDCTRARGPADGKVKQTAGAPRRRCDEKMYLVTVDHNRDVKLCHSSNLNLGQDTRANRARHTSFAIKAVVRARALE